MPELQEPLGFLNIWNDQHLDDLRPYHRHIIPDAIIIGTVETLKTLGEQAGLAYRPVFHHGDRFAVRVIMS